MWSNEATGSSAGFLNTSGNFGTQVGASPRDPKRERTNRSENVVPCTVAQIHRTTAEKVVVGRLIVHSISLVGMVGSVDEQSTRIIFQLDDMTGPPVEVQFWHGDGEDGDRRSRILEDTYVHVVGNVRTVRDKKMVLAYTVVPLSDLNRLSMHLLEVVHTGMAVALMPSDGAVLPQLASTIAPSARVRGNVDVLQKTHSTGDVINSGDNVSMRGLDVQQKMVFKVIMESTREEGTSCDRLREALPSLSPSQMKSVIEFLCNEGYIYSTIDEDHFKVTDSI